MKTNSVIALSSLLALVSSTPLAKRAMVVETVTEDVTVTVDTTTTVWIPPAKATAAPQQNYQQPAAKHGQMHQHLHTKAAAAVTSQPAQAPAPVVQAPQQAPPAQPSSSSSTPAPAPVYTPPPQAPAPVVQPTTSSTPPPAPQPTTQAPAPAQPSQASSQSEGSSGGACGTIGGQCTGDITYYQAGLGACGWNNDGSTEDVFALAYGMMGEQSNGNPYCGRMAKITVPGKAPVTAKLVDKCMGCQGQSIDLSNHLFDQLCDESVGRLHDVHWEFIS